MIPVCFSSPPNSHSNLVLTKPKPTRATRQRSSRAFLLRSYTHPELIDCFDFVPILRKDGLLLSALGLDDGWGTDQLPEAVIRIVVIHRLRSDQLVLNEESGGDLTVVEDVETQADQVVAVPFREISNGPDETGLGNSEFGSAFRRGVLSHYGTAVAATRFLESTQGSQRAWIVYRHHQHMA